jgi:hypothetical protein
MESIGGINMTTAFWIIMLVFFLVPFTVKPDGGYMGGMNQVFSFLLFWGAIVICAAGWLAGRLS